MSIAMQPYKKEQRAMNSDFNDADERNADPDGAPALFREFALACGAERDRRAIAGLAADDLRFDTSTADRGIAGFFAARLIAAAAKR